MRLKSRSGHTLVEVVIASLLIGMMTVPIMATVYNGRRLTERTTRRVQAAAHVRRLTEALKPYVVADKSLAQGPGTGALGWNLPGDTSPLTALAAGRHDLDPEVWLPDMHAAPLNGRISYDVAVRLTPQGPQPDVTVQVAWDEQ